MNRKLLLLLLSAISLLTAHLLAGDLKVKTARRVSSTGFLPSTPFKAEETIYVHDMVQREEFAGYLNDFQGPAEKQPPHMAVITHCDTGVVYQIDLDHQEYLEYKRPKYLTSEQFEKEIAWAGKEEERYTKANTIDTGEAKDFHGYVAKHLVTTIVKKTKDYDLDNTLDGWYVNLPKPGCAPEYLRWNRGSEPDLTRLAPGRVPRMDPERLTHLHEQPAVVYTGFEPHGFRISLESTLHQSLNLYGGNQDGSERITKLEVLEFSEAPIDPALFEVPPGFKKVRELYKHHNNNH